MYLNDVLI